MGICKLCNEERELKQSHIVPRAYFRRIKQKSGQSIHVTMNDDERPKKKNFDPKSYLLCAECEKFLSRNYEKYSIEYLRNRNNYTEEGKFLVFSKFNFNKIYIFFISILWRASISDHEIFHNIKMGGVDDYLKQSILQGDVFIEGGLKLDELIKVRIFRVIDQTNYFTPEIIENFFINFFFLDSEDYVSICFIVEGYLVCYSLGIFRSNRRLSGQINHRSFQVIPKISFENIPFLLDVFVFINKKAVAYPDL